MEGYTIKGNIEDARIAYDEVLSETKKEIESINNKLKCNEIEKLKLEIVQKSFPVNLIIDDMSNIKQQIIKEEKDEIEKRLEELEQNTNSEEFKKDKVRLSVLKDRLNYLNSRKREYTEE